MTIPSAIRLARTLLLLAGLIGACHDARAAQGVVSGRLLFYNAQGNYCPSNRDCSGAMYTQAQANRDMPVQEVKVYVGDSGGRTIGQGSTDSSGRFTVQWSSSAASVQGQILWYGEHRDGRFNLQTKDGARWVMWSGLVPLADGTTAASPQQMGDMTWGSAAAPHALANLYDGALRTWRYSLSASNRMSASFTGVAVRAFDPVACPTSCADGKRILIDSAASALSPQARIMHEMGHVASYLSKPGYGCGQYGYGGDASNTWSFTTPEWACASFEEGLATFFGDRAIYWQTNRNPVSCLSTGVCPDASDTNVERTMGAGNCTTNEGRWALSVDRYLRDLYDSTNDGPHDVHAVAFSTFFDTLARFGPDDGNRDVNEPWDETWFGWSIDDRDGRSAVDFKAHFEALIGQDTSASYAANCSPVGD